MGTPNQYARYRLRVVITKMVKLTDKQKRFVSEYLVDLNATQAAIRAGYSVRTAKQIATENLSKPAISASIQAEMDKRSRRTEITADRVLKELAKIGFGNVKNLYSNTGQLLNVSEILVSGGNDCQSDENLINCLK